jgi:hypothetical protein
MRSHHDMGGEPAGPVERSEHDYALWEKRVDALKALLSPPYRELVTTDEMRRNIEALPPDAYDKMTYYERWISAVTNTLLQRGVITADELGRKMAEVEGREATRT